MGYQLTQQDISELRAKGYKDSDIQMAVNELNNEDIQAGYNKVFSNNATDPRINASHSAFGTKQNDDIARWQLELNDILEKTEHTLRGDIIVFENNQLIWKPNPHPENNTLNENGVQICMKFLAKYINRSTILSDYTEEQISYKVLDFGKRMNDLIFKKYDEMGMDTEEKRKEYEMLVGAMTDMVHSAYARAKEGRERESFRKMTTISQASNGGMMQGGLTVNTGNPQQKVRGIFNPLRYIAGKYA